MRSIRQMAVAAVALGAFTSAFAAQTTVEFKTFYDTSTLFNVNDTKTLLSPIASIKLVDVDGGVQGTLKFKENDFPERSTGSLEISELWIANPGKKATITRDSGDTLKGTYYKFGFFKQGDLYNYDIDYTSSFKEGETSVFTIKGAGVSVGSFLSAFADGDKNNEFLLEVTGVGKPYSGFLGLNRNVRFIGELAPIPEPGTYALMGLGLVGVFVAARRSRQAA